MKDPTTWAELDLLQLIEAKQEEHLQLDFKSAEALTDTDRRKVEISKDVSAFANSAGGTIVYGMNEHADPPHYATNLSPVDPRAYSKEWLEQVIGSRIHPRIERLVVNPVELVTQHPGAFAYVVWIPESTTAHQASDKRYYRRFNFHSVPMEDYEIRQAMIRALGPVYSIRLSLVPDTDTAGGPRFSFRAVIQNEGYVVGKDVSVVVFVPPHLVTKPDSFRQTIRGVECCRIVGHLAPMPAPGGSVMPSAPPFTPFVVFFRRYVKFNAAAHLVAPLRVWVQVFDHLGLALTALFDFWRPENGAVPVEAIHAAKRAPGGFPVL